MDEESFEKRIAAAEAERDAVAEKRAREYPGSAEWTLLNHRVADWDSMILDLRRQAAQ